MTDNSSKTSSGCAGFFAIDRRVLPALIDLGMSAAVAYLVLARGTGPDNRITGWSINATEQHTGIPRAGAKAAIAALVARGLIRQTKTGSHPRYHIVPAHEVPGTIAAPREAMTDSEKRVFDKIAEGYVSPPLRGGSDWVWESPRNVALQLVEKRYLVRVTDSRFSVQPYDAVAAAAPDWVWLPNALIDGAAGEVAPVELLRQAHSLPALKLLILAYACHDLASYGGIHWRSVRRTYQRTRVTERGESVVWLLARGAQTAWPDRLPVSAFMTGTTAIEADKPTDTGWRIFWAAHELLEQVGLISTVAHLIDADTDDGAIVHPCPEADQAAEGGEHAVTAAARSAALAIADASKILAPYTSS